MSELIENIKILREVTGAGFLDCKNALNENLNNIDKSIDFLRKKGLVKATKKSSRAANEGAIGIYNNEKVTLLIEINTETDFAAKNDVFLNFIDMIGEYALNTNNHNLTIEEFNNISFNNRKISELFTDIIGKIGENIILNKLILIENNPNKLISYYIHNSYRKNIGKIGVLLQADVKLISEEAKILGKNLCMHIAASKPLAIDIDGMDTEIITKEEEVQRETIKSLGKSAEIIEKILIGKMRKYYSETTFLNQSYILDPEKNIRQVINDFSKNNEFKIKDYKLVSIGN